MKKFFLLLALCTFYFTLSLVSAHQPRITRDKSGPFEVFNPEISQAFYGELRGQPDVYTVTSDTGFLLYANIVVPAISGVRKDFIVTIMQGQRPLAILDGNTYQWTEFYEHFAGDLYYEGPSFEQKVPAGTYTISIQNNGNMGKYSLAIGKIESFPFDEIINTFKLLPSLKTYFFGKPAIMMFYNYIGIGLGILLVILVMLIVIVRGIVRKIKKKPGFLKSN